MRRRDALRLPALGGLLAGCSPTGVVNLLTPTGRTEVREDLAYGSNPRQRLDLYLPPGAGPETPVLVFLFGGSWDNGSKGQFAFVARPLAGLGVAVAVPNYRLWPEVRWPAFLEDCAAATAWLRGPAGRDAGAPGGPLLVMGHSAGAFNALALALDPRWLGAAGLPGGRGALAGAIGLAGVYDYQPDSDMLRQIFAAAPGGRILALPEDPAALRGTPPLLLLHGEADNTVRPYHSPQLAAQVRAAGGEATVKLYPGVGHIGILAAIASPVRALGLEGAPVLADVGAFVAARTGARPASIS